MQRHTLRYLSIATGAHIMKLITHTRRAFTALAFLGLLTSNVLTLTNSAFNAALSGLMGTAFGISTVADAMNTRLTKKNTQIASQQAAIKTQKKAAQRFGRRLTTRTGKLVATSIAELPAEAIPLLGIPVLIAATAYEIKMACDTLDDLDTLYAELGMDDRIDKGVMGEVCNPVIPSAQQLHDIATDYLSD